MERSEQSEQAGRSGDLGRKHERSRYGVGWLVRVAGPGLYSGHMGRVLRIAPDTYEGKPFLRVSVSEDADGGGSCQSFFYEELEPVTPPSPTERTGE